MKYRLIIEEFGGMELFQEVLFTIAKIADKYDAGIAEIATQYILQKPCVGGVIIGARDTNHLEKIKNLCFLTLDSEDIEEIHAVIGKARGPAGPVYSLERDREGRHGEIMKYNINKQ